MMSAAARYGTGIRRLDIDDSAWRLECAHARAPVDAAGVPWIRVERSIVQLDDHAESGVGEPTDD